MKEKRRIGMSVGGVVLCAISVSFFKHAALGMDSFQVFVNGMTEVAPISYGTLYVIVNIALLVFVLFTDKHYIGLATLINLFLLGYIAEFGLFVLGKTLPSPGIVIRIVCFVIGLVSMCIASALYYTSDLGVSTYDAIALVMAEKWKVARFPFCRIGVELVSVILGAVLYYIGNESMQGIGGLIGAGTIITAFCMGPLIQYFKVKIAIPMLNRE